MRPFTSKLGLIGQNRQCCLAGSSQRAPRILIFSIAMGADYTFYVKSIESHARAFLPLNNFSCISVSLHINWVWQIKICKLDFIWRWFWHPEIMEFEFQQPVFKEMTHYGLDSLWQKKLLKFTMIFHDSTKKKSYSKDQNKAEFKNLDKF